MISVLFLIGGDARIIGLIKSSENIKLSEGLFCQFFPEHRGFTPDLPHELLSGGLEEQLLQGLATLSLPRQVPGDSFQLASSHWMGNISTGLRDPAPLPDTHTSLSLMVTHDPLRFSAVHQVPVGSLHAQDGCLLT